MMTRETGEHVAKFRVMLDDFYETFPSGIRRSLWILFGAVSLLLLIACTNVSSLLLARAAARARGRWPCGRHWARAGSGWSVSS